MLADSKGFVVLPKRWVVERTHAWYERCRRLIMHHDRLLSVSAAWVWLSMLARRLTAMSTPSKGKLFLFLVVRFSRKSHQQRSLQGSRAG